MKKPIIILFLIQFTSNCFAQNTNTKYDTCQLLSQYQGEWRYTNGQDTIRIYLRYHRDYSASFNWVEDKLYGWLEYKNGNTIIESTYQNKNMTLPYNYDTDSMNVNFRSTRLKLKECNSTYSELTGTIIDHLEANEIHMVTAILSTNRTAILWKQTHGEGYGHGTGAVGMTLPKEFLLIKQ
jgi:hypothetical protein